MKLIFLGIILRVIFASGDDDATPTTPTTTTTKTTTIGTTTENPWKTLRREGKITINVNEYVDDLLETARDWLKDNGHDPMKLPDVNQTLSMNVNKSSKTLIDYRGKLLLTNGKLSHLTHIRRRGDIMVTYDDKNLITIKASAIARKLLVQYDYLAHIMDMGPSGKIFGNVENVIISGLFTIDSKTFLLRMKKLYIQSISRIQITFDGGFKLSDMLVNSMLNVMTTVFKDQIKYVFSREIKGYAQQGVDEINRRNAAVAAKQRA